MDYSNVMLKSEKHGLSGVYLLKNISGIFDNAWKKLR